MKKPSIKDIYKGIRKPMPPPAKAEPDRRAELESEEAKREIDRYKRRRKGKEDDG
jgi:hypothetical protein